MNTLTFVNNFVELRGSGGLKGIRKVQTVAQENHHTGRPKLSHLSV